MNIKYKHNESWDGHNIQVFLNGKKYPLERGAVYLFYKNKPIKELKKQAKSWAIAESNGKYLSSDGVIYNNRQEYLNYLDLI